MRQVRANPGAEATPPGGHAFNRKKSRIRMNGNRHISLITEEHQPQAIVVPIRRAYFLQKKLHFYLLLAVTGTTLLSWFNLNSWLIITLAVCRLFAGKPLVAIRTAFHNGWFLAWSSIFLLEVTGLFHTHDLFAAWMHVESKATLVAVPFLLCAGPFADRKDYRRLGMAYCILLAGLCLICLAVAVRDFTGTGDGSVFFYHSLTAVLDSNAVFFSGYVLMALLFLLSDPLAAGKARTGFILFFITMMVLLASKLLLALMVAVLGIYLFKRYRVRVRRWRLLVLAGLVVLSVGMLAFFSNPVRDRYSDMSLDEISAVSFRLFVWRSAAEILNEKHAWMFGVSAGDSRDLLNAKYMSAGLSKGYIGYNCQNEYMEVLLRSGVMGLIVLAAAIAMLIRLAQRKGTIEVWLAVITILLLSFTESTLEMQQPAFLCCFFPLLFANS